jgi:hypothetical protein
MRKINPTLYGFKSLTGDCNYLDYGATWCRLIPGTREYHIISLINWEDSCGEREAKEIGETYCMDLSIVDLDAIPLETIQSALKSCGVDLDTEEMTDEWRAEVCHSDGAQAPMQSVNTSNFHKTFRALAKYSRELQTDADKHSAAMERPVNKLGSTADEYMRGDLTSALARGIERGDTNARIIAKIYGYKEND